jgi:hypothetical protein
MNNTHNVHIQLYKSKRDRSEKNMIGLTQKGPYQVNSPIWQKNIELH